MADVEVLDPAYVRMITSDVVVEQYVSVASMCVLVYHTLLHLDKEVKYFWSKPWNTVSLVFFANQYSGILGAVCVIICLFSYWGGGITSWANISLIDYILTIRVLALYNQDRKLTFCPYALLALETVSELGLAVYSGVVDKGDAHVLCQLAHCCSPFLSITGLCGLVDNLTACCNESNSLLSIDVVSWAMPIAYGLFLLVLSLYKAAEYWKMSSNLKAFPLVKVLVEDQVMYYIFVISCCVLRIVDLLDFDTSDFAGAFINAVANPTFLCILGSRILINLKEAGEKLTNGGTNNSQAISSIKFA